MANPYRPKQKAHKLYEFLRSNQLICYQDFLDLGYARATQIITKINSGDFFELKPLGNNKYKIYEKNNTNR